MQPYDHRAIEQKWQKRWEEEKPGAAHEDSGKEKSYLLVEFPYPSGAGLHVGHVRSYTAMDIVARKRRREGKEVLYPIGWDAFGLPTENYAIKTGRNPREVTRENIATFRRQLKLLGISFDWDREVDTTDPDYYKWTQWIFLQLFKKGLAYKAHIAINWCPRCKIGLANEEVVDGACERCGSPVEKREKEQWMLKITEYAQRLYDDLDTVDYIERAKTQQRNWIGPSTGAELQFEVKSQKSKVKNAIQKVKVTDDLSVYNFVLLHGFTGSPEANFFPWLKEELEQRGAKVQVPKLPDSDQPTEEGQVGYVLEHCIFDENTILLGHSLGTVVALKVLEKLQKPIKGLVIVGGFCDPTFRDRARNFEATFDWGFEFEHIKKSCDFIHVLHDPNDDAITDGQMQRLSQALSVEAQITPGEKSHFCDTEEPKILNAILSQVTRHTSQVTVFTTRPDTLFGATYLVLAPEHTAIKNLKTEIENWDEVEAYIQKTKQKTDMERTVEGKEKTGVELKGVKAINPANKEEIPIWVADYVLASYGTGAIMAVPAHDERDYAFAKTHGLPIRKVVDKNKYLIFDFDGVIGNTYEACLKSKIAMGYCADMEEALQDMLSYATKVPAHARSQATPESIAFHDDWTKKFGEEMKKQDISLFTGFIHEIEKLENTKIAIVSSGSELYIKPAIENKKLIFSHVLSYENNPSKEEKIELICKDWGVGVEDIYYFTDTVADVLELENLIDRSKIIGCAWGFLGKEKLEEILPREQVLENHQDIHDLFDEMHTDDGLLIHSGAFNGLHNGEAKQKITEYVGGKMVTRYKLRDWVFSRQRYWGEPIPLVHCEKCSWQAVAEEQLPVELPKVEKYEPTDTGESPLAAIEDWVETICPACGGPARRETDVMPNWAGSSWYFLRYPDPQNDTMLADKKNLAYWMPVDWYNGGMEHTVLHLLYSRFWHKFLYDLGVVPTPEPYQKRTSHGIILAEDGEKMSKSRGNVINPDDIVERFGADALRVYEMFMGPFDQAIAWSTNGLVGAKRFLERVERLQAKVAGELNEEEDTETHLVVHKTIKKVTEDIEALKMNTAISQLMILTNALEKSLGVPSLAYRVLLLLLAPFAPHLTQELWERQGHLTSIHSEPWPIYNEALLREETATIAVQVNGKMRDTVVCAAGTSEREVAALAKVAPRVAKYLEQGEVRRIIFVPDRVINFII